MAYTVITFIPFVLFFMFDNYIGGFRPFDFLGLFLLFCLTILQVCNQRGRLWASGGVLLFAGVLFIFLNISLLVKLDEFKPHVGVALGLLVFVCYSTLGEIDERFERCIDWMLRISVATIFIQLFIYFVSGHYLELLLFNDVGGARASYGGVFLRPTGIFMEPNDYCVPTALLILLRQQIKRRFFDKLSYVAILSMITSLSLWGALMGVVLIIYDQLKRRNFKIVILTIVFLAGLFTMSAEYLGEQNSLKIALIDRISNIASGGSHDKQLDGSYTDRYSFIANLFDLDKWDYGTLFGHGLSIRQFQDYGGANAIAFLIYSVGLFGILLLLMIVLLGRLRWDAIFAIVISFSSYPFVTYFFWWAWLALLLKASKQAQKQRHLYSA